MDNPGYVPPVHHAGYVPPVHHAGYVHHGGYVGGTTVGMWEAPRWVCRRHHGGYGAHSAQNGENMVHILLKKVLRKEQKPGITGMSGM